MQKRLKGHWAVNVCEAGDRDQDLKDVVLWGEHEVLATDGEADIGHGGDLVAVHDSLAGGDEGQGIADGQQALFNLLLCLVVCQGHLKKGDQFLSLRTATGLMMPVHFDTQVQMRYRHCRKATCSL